jgi:DNA-binding NarL/FixJ family response regulator
VTALSADTATQPAPQQPALQPTGAHLVPGAPASVLLISDDLAFSQCVRAGLGTAPGALLLTVIRHGRLAPRLVRSLQPHVILLDTAGLRGAAPAYLAGIRAASPAARVVALDAGDEPGIMVACLSNGGSGYLRKDRAPRLLASYLRLLGEASGEAVLLVPPQRPAWWLPGGPARDGGPGAGETAVSCLSSRERQVIELMGDALTNSQIGRRLGITEGTVKRHARSIFAKLNAVSRLDAVKRYSSGAW